MHDTPPTLRKQMILFAIGFIAGAATVIGLIVALSLATGRFEE